MSGVDMSASAISARLRQVSREADLRPEQRLVQKVDMSPSALSRRLRRVSELRRLCLKLGQMKPVSPVTR